MCIRMLSGLSKEIYTCFPGTYALSYNSVSCKKEGTSMAADDQRKERKQQGRVGPSIDASKASRVSKAAGGIGSESMRVEQRSNTPATKQRANNPVPARRSRGGKQPAKKGNRPPDPTPADSRLIGNMHRK